VSASTNTVIVVHETRDGEAAAEVRTEVRVPALDVNGKPTMVTYWFAGRPLEVIYP
jgi:hypothetical protein